MRAAIQNLSAAERSDPDEEWNTSEEDVDAPRVLQWAEDDQEVHSEAEETAPATLNSLQQDLSSLPLGTLLKAQRALKQVAVSDSEDDDSSEDEVDDDTGDESSSEPQAGSPTKGKGKEVEVKLEWSTKPRHDIPKRTNKHAPTEVTSKRPVTRRRTVVKNNKIQPRDPRFLPLAGQLEPDQFQKHYGFLADSHKTELQTLRENLKLARRRLASSPRDLRAEREAEVDRLERAVKRTESLVNQDRKAKIDRDALSSLRDAEKTKQKDGKKAWFMKESEKKQVLMRARYDALAAEGGNRAVKKAMEKRQRKVGQKEKKSRPFAKGTSGLKRRVSDDAGSARKKRRTD